MFFRIELRISGGLGVLAGLRLPGNIINSRKASLCLSFTIFFQNWIVDVWSFTYFFMGLCLSSDCLMHLGIKKNSSEGLHSRLL